MKTKFLAAFFILGFYSIAYAQIEPATTVDCSAPCADANSCNQVVKARINYWPCGGTFLLGDLYSAQIHFEYQYCDSNWGGCKFEKHFDTTGEVDTHCTVLADYDMPPCQNFGSVYVNCDNYLAAGLTMEDCNDALINEWNSLPTHMCFDTASFGLTLSNNPCIGNDCDPDPTYGHWCSGTSLNFESTSKAFGGAECGNDADGDTVLDCYEHEDCEDGLDNDGDCGVLRSVFYTDPDYDPNHSVSCHVCGSQHTTDYCDYQGYYYYVGLVDECSKCDKEGCPIKAKTGEMTHDIPLWTTDVYGPQLSFTVSYNSYIEADNGTANADPAGIGINWTHSFGYSLSDDGQHVPQKLRIMDNTGETIYFNWNTSTNRYEGNKTETSYINSCTDTNYWCWHLKDGSRMEFLKRDNKLTYINDENGNRLTFTYDKKGTLRSCPTLWGKFGFFPLGTC